MAFWGGYSVLLPAAAQLNSGPGDQTLTPSLFTNTGSLAYSHALTPGEVTLTQSTLFNNSNFLAYTHTASQSLVLTQASLDNGYAWFDVTTDSTDSWFDELSPVNPQSFYSHTVSQLLALSQASTYTNTNSYYEHTLTPGIVTLTQTTTFTNSPAWFTANVTIYLNGELYSGTPSFYTHSLSATYSLTAAKYDNSNSFFSHSVNLGLTATDLYSNTNSHFAHSLTTTVGLTQSVRFDSTESFYTHSLEGSAGPQDLTQSARYDSTNSFYAHTTTPGPVTLVPQLYSNTNQFFAGTLTQQVVLNQNSRFDATNSFYTQLVAVEQFLVPVTFVNANTTYLHSVRNQYPDPSMVLYGTKYGEGGLEFTGTYQSDMDRSIKVDLVSGKLVKPLNNKVVLTF